MSAYDPDTGELFEERPDHQTASYQSNSRETISQRASSGVKAPGYWDKRQGIMKTSEDRWFADALLKVQGEIPAIFEADAINPFHKSKYTTLGQLLSRIRPVLQKHELVLKQGAGKIYAHGGGSKDPKYFMPVFMEIAHAKTGESERQMVEIPLTKLDPQAIGIAITYGRRYLLQSYFGIASMDDDAASAVQKRLDKDEEAAASAGIEEKIKACTAISDLTKIAGELQHSLNAFSDATLEKLRNIYAARLRDLQDAQPETAKKAKPSDLKAASNA